MSKRGNTLVAMAGFLLVIFVASRIGWHTVARQLVAVRAGIAIIILLSAVRLVLQTRSWAIALRRDGSDVGTGRLMLTRLASQGIGYLTVLGPVASEPMKISLLRKHAASPATATLVDTGVYWFTSGLVAIAGCLAACLLLSNSSRYDRSALAAALLFTAGLIALARPKLRLAPLAGRLDGRCPNWLRKAVQIESAIREFARDNRSAIRQMFLLDLACQLLMAAEVAAVLYFLSLPLHAGTILGIEGACRMVKMAAGWMPARIGADEGGAASAFLSFGLPASAGLTLAPVRRSRDLLACLVGLTWLAFMSRRSVDSAPSPVDSLNPQVGEI